MFTLDKFQIIENNNRIPVDLVLDARFKGNLTRMINHSCDPNCIPQTWVYNGEPRIFLFSNKNIYPKEELNYHYGHDLRLLIDSCAEDDQVELEKCICHSQNCTGFVGLKAQDKVLYNEYLLKISFKT